MFPLPLTALEEYMLCDDSPAFPMTGMVRARFRGFLDRAAWQAAVDVCVQRNALLRCTVQRRRGRRPRWIDQPDWRPTIQWEAPANRYGFPAAGYIDLTQEPGTRFWVLRQATGHDVVAQVHHACSDGLGISRLLEELLVAYAKQVNPNLKQVELPEPDLVAFGHRGAPGLTAGQFLKTAHKQAVGIIGAVEFLRHSPVPLKQPALPPDLVSPPPAYPCSRRYDFSVEETRRVLAAAKRRQATLNDLMARDMFLAVDQWRRARGIGGPADWLRFSIPMNLRRAEDARMPMANSVGSVFLDRRGPDCADPEQLLRGIGRQMQRIKRLQLQYTFGLFLGMSRFLPGGIARQMRTDKCQLTTYFSNLGPVLNNLPLPRRDGRIACGDAVLEAVDYIIPLRPWVNASFCVYTYAGQLCILMHPDPRVLSEADAADLLERFVGRLRRSAEMESGGSAPE